MNRKWIVAVPLFAILAWAAGTEQDAKTVISSATKPRPRSQLAPIENPESLCLTCSFPKGCGTTVKSIAATGWRQWCGRRSWAECLNPVRQGDYGARRPARRTRKSMFSWNTAKMRWKFPDFAGFRVRNSLAGCDRPAGCGQLQRQHADKRHILLAGAGVQCNDVRRVVGHVEIHADAITPQQKTDAKKFASVFVPGFL